MNYSPCFLCPQWTGKKQTVCSAQFNSLTQDRGKDICKNAQSPLPDTYPNSLAIPHTAMWIGTLDFTVRRLAKNENTWVRKVNPEDPTQSFPEALEIKGKIFWFWANEKRSQPAVRSLYFLAATTGVRENQTHVPHFECLENRDNNNSCVSVCSVISDSFLPLGL